MGRGIRGWDIYICYGDVSKAMKEDNLFIFQLSGFESRILNASNS